MEAPVPLRLASNLDRMTLGVDFDFKSQLSQAAFLGQLAFLVALLVAALVVRKRWFRE